MSENKKGNSFPNDGKEDLSISQREQMEKEIDKLLSGINSKENTGGKAENTVNKKEFEEIFSSSDKLVKSGKTPPRAQNVPRAQSAPRVQSTKNAQSTPKAQNGQKAQGVPRPQNVQKAQNTPKEKKKEEPVVKKTAVPPPVIAQKKQTSRTADTKSKQLKGDGAVFYANKSAVSYDGEDFMDRTKIVAGKSKKKRRLIVFGAFISVVIIAATFMGMMFFNPNVIPAASVVGTEESNSTTSGGTDAGSSDEATNETEESKETEPTTEAVFTFAKGVMVFGVDISGKELDDAIGLLKLHESNMIEKFELSIVSSISPDFVLTRDDFVFDYSLQDAIDYAVEASEIINSSPDGSGTLPEAPEGLRVDVENDTVNVVILPTPTEESIAEAVERAVSEINVKAEEPRVVDFDPSQMGDAMFSFAEGSTGYAVDKEDLTEKIRNYLNDEITSGSIEAVVNETNPKLSMEDVKKSTRILAVFSTVSGNSANGNHNMGLAMSRISGEVVEAGDIFSFSSLTGNTDLESEGYLSANIIMNGEYVPGIGGGVCQAATTIYNACVLANMEVVERAPHKWCSPYVYGGMDATIAEGAIDLKMRNQTDYQMFFKTYMEGTVLTCEIYGWQSPDFDEIRTETFHTGSDDNNYYYDAQRVFYKDGTEQWREDLPSSSYGLEYGIVPPDPGNVSNRLDWKAVAEGAYPSDCFIR